mmetsp:Transcript_17309/g.37372  ORF Transcript_17309/g.37372 Transcript_17309/m.37372 type:complete len:308 (-) Transcript_17309:965-1888(-)
MSIQTHCHWELSSHLHSCQSLYLAIQTSGGNLLVPISIPHLVSLLPTRPMEGIPRLSHPRMKREREREFIMHHRIHNNMQLCPDHRILRDFIRGIPIRIILMLHLISILGLLSLRILRDIPITCLNMHPILKVHREVPCIIIQGHTILKLSMLLLQLHHPVPVIKHLVPNDGVSIIPRRITKNATSRHRAGLRSLSVPTTSRYSRRSIPFQVLQVTSLMWYQVVKMAMPEPRECTAVLLFLSTAPDHRRRGILTRGMVRHHLQAGMDTTPVVPSQRSTMPSAWTMVPHLAHHLRRTMVVIQESIPLR